jgi:hypothetical protein
VRGAAEETQHWLCAAAVIIDCECIAGSLRTWYLALCSDNRHTRDLCLGLGLRFQSQSLVTSRLRILREFYRKLHVQLCVCRLKASVLWRIRFVKGAKY